MFLTIGAIIAGIAALGVAVAVVVYLTITIVRRYLNGVRSKVNSAAKRFITRYREGNYDRISAGIWNDTQERVTDGSSWKAENLDADLSTISNGEVQILDYD